MKFLYFFVSHSGGRILNLEESPPTLGDKSSTLRNRLPVWGTNPQPWGIVSQFGGRIRNLGKTSPILEDDFPTLGKRLPFWGTFSYMIYSVK